MFSNTATTEVLLVQNIKVSSYPALALLLYASCALAQTPRQAVNRALNYLTDEVPRWKKENGCFSCHNNGDAARALMRGKRVEAVRTTIEWLGQPRAWDRQQASAAFRDEKLARIQFAFALTEAVQLGMGGDKAAVGEAGRMLKEMQAEDGSWPLEEEASIGSPATYGTALSTYAAIRVLGEAGGAAAEIARARRWLKQLKAVATVDLAAQILAAPDDSTAATQTLLGMQTIDGAWGPYRATSAEPFDTALAILALGRTPQAQKAIERGVAWLVNSQLENGGWAATTRPSGNVSYAQHISTTGWVTLALLSRLE